ncbi:hypothetical protein JAAARDRAFT_637136 [Jaapia argillacea MUCL 33604]|uniref:Uncharacterized protein n=1 Tax=Jaapia argillacea MUCL 33604 TaxID=933084 RepID=A0A067QBJ2_9AGAM|nr:hypothetical protein JAAARDRAFT_637136 [Jaapia argillacea MUCL 33604]
MYSLPLRFPNRPKSIFGNLTNTTSTNDTSYTTTKEPRSIKSLLLSRSRKASPTLSLINASVSRDTSHPSMPTHNPNTPDPIPPPTAQSCVPFPSTPIPFPTPRSTHPTEPHFAPFSIDELDCVHMDVDQDDDPASQRAKAWQAELARRRHHRSSSNPHPTSPTTTIMVQTYVSQSSPPSPKLKGVPLTPPSSPSKRERLRSASEVSCRSGGKKEREPPTKRVKCGHRRSGSVRLSSSLAVPAKSGCSTSVDLGSDCTSTGKSGRKERRAHADLEFLLSLHRSIAWGVNTRGTPKVAWSRLDVEMDVDGEGDGGDEGDVDDVDVFSIQDRILLERLRHHLLSHGHPIPILLPPSPPHALPSAEPLTLPPILTTTEPRTPPGLPLPSPILSPQQLVASLILRHREKTTRSRRSRSVTVSGGGGDGRGKWGQSKLRVWVDGSGVYGSLP